MNFERWYKKDVTFAWEGHVTSYAVAQELFSSHDVDAGSKLLLRSLDVSSLPMRGRAIDFGCGCGVLGLALKNRLPEWRVGLIDRDALAVAFSRHNATRHGVEDSVEASPGLGPSGPADLILWNVPGKAGDVVIRALARDAALSLEEGGLLALVVVHPLVEAVKLGIAADDGVAIELEESQADHTVLHVRRQTSGSTPGEPFARGVFDREPAAFGVDDFDYDITPAFGLPEYDSYSFSTQVTFDILRTVVRRVESALIFRPGQGHVPIVVAHTLAPRSMVLADRDLLALRASERALRDTGTTPPTLALAAVVDLRGAVEAKSVDLCVMVLEDQVRNDVHLGRLEDLAGIACDYGQVVAGGSSSTVSRFLALAAKTRNWKLRDRTKRSGASAARLERIPGA